MNLLKKHWIVLGVLLLGAFALYWNKGKFVGFAPAGTPQSGNWYYEVEVSGNRQFLTVSYPPDQYLPILARQNISVMSYRRA